MAQRNILLAASTDSAITMYRVRDWVLLRSLKGHKGRVNSIDAHPAGRVALSVGQDKMLRMWDLVAGKAVATMKVGEGMWCAARLNALILVQRATWCAGTRTGLNSRSSAARP